MKRSWAIGLARAWARWRLPRALDGVWVDGLERARSACAAGPVVFCATHVGFWDGLVLLPVDEALGTDSYALMDAAQLARLPFFSAIGAVPLDRTSSATMRRGLLAAAALLDRPGRALWVFPQGRHRPPHLRPLGLGRGHALLARRTGATVVPVALSYGFRASPSPAAVLSFGQPLVRADDVDELEAALVDGLDRADRFIDVGAGPFRELLPSRGSRVDHSLGARVLARLAGNRRALGG